MQGLSSHDARHPTVNAAQIAEVHYSTQGASIFLPGGQFIDVSAEWLAKNKPRAMDYLIFHADGSTASMTSAEFNAAYTRT